MTSLRLPYVSFSMADNENNSDNNSDIIVDMRNTSSYFNKANEVAISPVLIPTLFEPEANFHDDFSIQNDQRSQRLRTSTKQ